MTIPPEIKKCVAFLGFNSQNGFKLAGTVFFVSLPMDGVDGKQFIYLITAKHVIDKIREYSSDNKVCIRINNRTGSIDVVVSNVDQWKFHPTDSSVDAAVLPWAPSQELFDYLCIPALDMAITDELLQDDKLNISIGDEVFLTGLFSTHYGKKRNLPIIRVGNIAMMPEEKVYTDALGEIEAYLIESRSIGGLSGSPVFVYLGHMRPDKDGNINLGGSSKIFYWLGLMHGHWDMPTKKVDVVDEDHATIGQVNMGIAIVVPAQKIMEVINSEELKKQREETIRKIRMPLLQKPDIV